MEKMEKAFALFDAVNRQDPTVIMWEGVHYAAEYFYALQLHHWVRKLEPAAPEALLLASRAQHIGRWRVPRSAYPAGKPGYLQWRTGLSKSHADQAGLLMGEAGYDAGMVKAVQRIILKQQLRTDATVQVMENALCLVFLEFQFDAFLTKHDEQKVIGILQKSWAKMTEPGRTAALGISYNDKAKRLLLQALGR